MEGRLKQIKRNTVAVAMSGGVDSTVTAALLKEKGYSVRGVFMVLAQPDLQLQVQQVRNVAERLSIPIELIDLSQPFDQAVLNYFRESYYHGRTPNPCIICNREIKFGRLREAILQSADFMATGHYARIEHDPQKGYRLLKGRDQEKDQSYFLSSLNQQQLGHIIFPLGNLTKTEVYGLARELGFASFHKGKESQDVCFLKGRSVNDFLMQHPDPSVKPGKIVTLSGKSIGRHQGIHRYTIGQRRGLGIPDQTPYYVVALDPANNQVFVGKQEDLWHRRVWLKNINWIAGKQPEMPQYFMVKIRYRHEPARAEVAVDRTGTMIVRFDEPQRAITPGQFAVLYKDDEVIAAGEIDTAAASRQ